MSISENALNQAKDLIESLVLMQEQVSNQAHAIEQHKAQLKEADANLNALQGAIESKDKYNSNLLKRLEEEVRKNEKLRMGLSQFVSLMEQAQPAADPPARKEPEPEVNEVPKTEVTENTATQPPFYGIHIENGETIIYPPQRCQTLHQLSQFYRLAGLVISHDKLMERRGIHLRGLSSKHRARLNSQYDFKLPHKVQTWISFAPSPTHGLPEEPGQIR